MNRLDGAARAATLLQDAASAEARRLAGLCVRGGRVSTALLDEHQVAAYHLAFLAAEAATAAAVVEYGARGDLEELLAAAAVAELTRSARSRLDGTPLEEVLSVPEVSRAVAVGSDPAVLDALAASLERSGTGPRHLNEDLALVADTFAAFADAEVAPHAEAVHRGNLDVPEGIIAGMAKLGAFGMSIPETYGGFADPDAEGALAMVVATEELSRGSLMAGSLLTRPEILVTALLAGGTEEQRRRWLPSIASGERMVAVSVTEPDYGSDVASITTAAVKTEDGWVIDGAKMWATFAGRAELLMVLARTDADRSTGARGLSLFVVEKPPCPGPSFELTQPGGGRLSGRAIDTIGYRGLHSFELTFDGWTVPHDALIGGEPGAGRGFYLQMGAFASGRLQTAARALGVAEAAFRAALAYAADRAVFGRRLAEYPLTKWRLARMAAQIQAGRRLTYRAAANLGSERGEIEAAMAKALTSRAAEEITRDAMQLHGGYGYAEEYPVSRLFVDARVLSIFEGTEEVLALRVIARDLIGRAGDEA